jgi:hypothetical protein
MFCTDTVIRWVCLLLQRKWKLSDEIFKIVRSARVDPDVLSYGEGRKKLVNLTRLWLLNHAVRFKAQRLSCTCATRFPSPKSFSHLGPNLFQDLPCSRNCMRSWPWRRRLQLSGIKGESYNVAHAALRWGRWHVRLVDYALPMYRNKLNDFK